MEMTVEQQRAMALANARRRAEEAGGGERDSLLGKVDSAVRGAADVLSFGLADEAAAGADALEHLLAQRAQGLAVRGDQRAATAPRLQPHQLAGGL